MKWIGQRIYDQISRFRNDVYLEDLSTTTETSVLVVNSHGKISKSTTLADDIIESEIDTLAGLTSFGAAGATTNILAGDLTMYNAVSDGSPTISLGSSATNRLEIASVYNSGTQTLDEINFTNYTTSGTTNDGRFKFYVDEVLLMALLDAGMSVYGNVTLSADTPTFTASDSTTSSATQGGKLILQSDDGAAMGDDHRLGVIEFKGAEDASNNRTIGARIEAMCDAAWSTSENGGRLDFYTTDADASESKVLTLDSDKAASFAGDIRVATGGITAGSVTLDGDKSVTPGDGGAVHVDAHTVTDSNTSGSGTAAKYTHVNIEKPRLAATNASVTTTNAATLYVQGDVTADDNQTITNNYALWVDSGNVKFDGDLTVDGTITSDVTGDLTGQADTVATIAGLAPNTATTQATQPNITTLAGLTTIGATGVNTVINSDDVQMYNPVNDGNPQLAIGSSATNQAIIWASYVSGTQNLEFVRFGTYTTSGTANHGYFNFSVDEVSIMNILDTGISLNTGFGIDINGTDILTDSSGTATLSNIDALDATTEATIESAIDTLGNLTSASSLATVGTIGTGVWQGTAIASAYIADDAVTFAKALGVTPNVYGSNIKLIPSDFAANDDGGNTKFGVGYVEHASGGTPDSDYGMRPANSAVELFAFVSIPEGMKATHVMIHAKGNYGVEVFEGEIDGTAFTSRSSGGAANTLIDMDDVDASATNFLTISVNTTATTHKVYGGYVTIAAQ